MANTKTKTPKRKPGRPPVPECEYSFEKGAPVFEYMLENKCGFTTACRAVGLPLMRAYDWLRDHKEFADAYARAVEIRTDMLFEEAEQLARTPLQGEIVTTTIGTNDGKKVNKKDIRRHDAVDRSRLIVDTIKWGVARMRPRKYGAGVEAPTKEDEGGNDKDVRITGGLPDDEPNA